MKSAWIYLFIIVGGMLQAFGAPMNGALFASLQNKWLATSVSFIVVTFFFIVMFLIQPTPLPTMRDLAHMPWWAPIGGLVGAVQVYAGLTLVQRRGRRAVHGTYCDRRSHRLRPYPSLRLVSHAGPSDPFGPRGWCRVDGGRHHADCKVLIEKSSPCNLKV